MLIGTILAGFLFGFWMAVYYRATASKLNLPQQYLRQI
jgi:hypothetical protein